MGESRQELLGWMNNLLQLDVTRVEQCGTGAALCQIYDSIFLDLPMARVKFNVNTEYAYIQNFKILQSAFTKHGIDRIVPVQSLIKCKMQDNLEFLQWSKRYWDQYFPGHEYDPIARRKASGAPPASSSATASPLRTSTTRAPPTTAARRPPASSNTAVSRAPAPRVGSASSGGGAANAALMNQVAEMKEQVVGLERERDFYFNKLRDIEVLLQQEVELKPELEQAPESLIGRLMAILYSTEDGFEIPADEGEEGVVPMVGGGEEETF